MIMIMKCKYAMPKMYTHEHTGQKWYKIAFYWCHIDHLPLEPSPCSGKDTEYFWTRTANLNQ